MGEPPAVRLPHDRGRPAHRSTRHSRAYGSEAASRYGAPLLSAQEAALLAAGGSSSGSGSGDGAPAEAWSESSPSPERLPPQRRPPQQEINPAQLQGSGAAQQLGFGRAQQGIRLERQGAGAPRGAAQQQGLGPALQQPGWGAPGGAAGQPSGYGLSLSEVDEWLASSAEDDSSSSSAGAQLPRRVLSPLRVAHDVCPCCHAYLLLYRSSTPRALLLPHRLAHDVRECLRDYLVTFGAECHWRNVLPLRTGWPLISQGVKCLQADLCTTHRPRRALEWRAQAPPTHAVTATAWRGPRVSIGGDACRLVPPSRCAPARAPT